MGRITRTIQEAFRSAMSSPQIEDHEAAKDEIAKGVVQRTASGSVLLHRGEFLTSDEIDKERERLKSWEFDDAR